MPTPVAIKLDTDIHSRVKALAEADTWLAQLAADDDQDPPECHT